MTPEDVNSDLDFDAALHGKLEERQRAAWNEGLRGGGALLEGFLDQAEVEARLRWHFGHRLGSGSAGPGDRAGRGHVPRRWAVLGIAAAAAALVWMALDRRGPGPGDGPASELDAWRVVSVGDADFERVRPDLVRLRRGELHIESAQGSPGSLRVETPWGLAEASGTSFLIGCHSTQDEGNSMLDPIVRVLVLAGSVTLGNALGDVRAEAGELVSIQGDERPELFVARATSDFGLDLLRASSRRLDGIGLEPGRNVVFSPYSIAATLAMAAEGARGETAREFERVLHLPRAAQRQGSDPQTIPLQVALIQSGFRDIEARLAHASTLDQSDLFEQVAVVDSELRALAVRLFAAELAEDYGLHDRLRKEEERLLDQHRDLLGRAKTYRVGMARGLWGERSFPFHPDYLASIEGAYGPETVFPADFRRAPRVELDRVNAWVSERTEGMIRTLLEPGDVEDLTRLILVNAIHFRGDWVEAFEPEDTEAGPFRLVDGTTSRVEFMHAPEMETARYGAFEADGTPFETPARYLWGEDPPKYPGDGGYTVLSLPYRGEDIDFMAILPRSHDGLASLEAGLSHGALESILEHLRPRTVDVAIPKLEIDTQLDLAVALEELGLLRAFRIPQPDVEAGDAADFSGMIAPRGDGDGVFLSKVLHRAVLSLDERGTTAAAATAAVFAAGSAERWISFTPSFRADHPFLILIRERSTGALLFLGRIQSPTG